MTQREEFEKWCKQRGYTEGYYFFRQSHPNHYDDDQIEEMWNAWKAAKEQAVPEWIPVSERLPMDGEKVLIFDKYCAYGSIYRLMYYDGFMLKHKGVTHWIPLPAVPEQQK